MVVYFFIGAQTGHEAGKNQTGFAIQITNIRYPEPCYLANLIFLIVNLYPYRTIVFTFFLGGAEAPFKFRLRIVTKKKDWPSLETLQSKMTTLC